MRLTFFELLGKSRKIEKYLTFEIGVKGTPTKGSKEHYSIAG